MKSMSFKKVLSCILAASMITTLTACGGGESKEDKTNDAGKNNSEDVQGEGSDKTTEENALKSLEPVELVVYSPGNEESVPTKTIVEYKKLVEKDSQGQITLDVHYAGELGNDAEALQSLRMGTIDIAFCGTSGYTEFYDKAKIFDLPFLFDSAEQAYELINTTDVGEMVFGDMEDVGLVYLAEGDNGMRQISTTEREINSVEDVSGLKIRVPQSQMYIDVWTKLGATPISLDLNELSLALSNGTAEAQDNATYHIVANATYDSLKCFSFINYMWMGCTMAANADSFNALPEEYQKILRDNAVTAAKYSFDTIDKDNVTARKTLEEKGVKFNDHPDIQSFRDKLGKDYYKQYSSESWYNQDLIDKIQSK